MLLSIIHDISNAHLILTRVFKCLLLSAQFLLKQDYFCDFKIFKNILWIKVRKVEVLKKINIMELKIVIIFQTSEGGLRSLAILLLERSNRRNSRKPRKEAKENSRNSLCVKFKHFKDLRG